MGLVRQWQDPGDTLDGPGGIRGELDMFKISTLVCAVACLAASQALAAPPSAPAGPVLLASEAGLYVRIDSASATTHLQSGNVYGSAVNTGGVSRATAAVRSGNRVFLTGRPAGGGVSEVHLASAETSRPEAKPTRRPEGLVALVARVLGL